MNLPKVLLPEALRTRGLAEILGMYHGLLGWPPEARGDGCWGSEGLPGAPEMAE